MKILLTGAAGFIGFHLARRFLERGDFVYGIDNLNDYYDVSLKRARLGQLEPFRNFSFAKIDISDRAAMEKLFSGNQFDCVVHMAAQAGVRYSFKNPHAYVESNIVGFLNVLEGCRLQWKSDARRATRDARQCLIYASSSSVYGGNTKLPFSTSDSVDRPISLYAATKRADELMAYTYNHLYSIPAAGLRFFTVYGPWGRPDMALFKFTKAILNGDPIDVYGEGRMKRDFTYIDDVVEGVVRITSHELRVTSHSLYNIGNHSPIGLMDFIRAIENALDKKAKLNFLPIQPGDVPETYADIGDLMRDVGFTPNTRVTDGVKKFVEWYRDYYKT